MMHCFSERRMMIIQRYCLIFSSFFNLMFVLASPAMHLCRPDQRDALWELKRELSIQDAREALWGFIPNTTKERWRKNTDCCSWVGVSCGPKTGEVVELDLSDSYLYGPLRSNSSLFRLQHLQSLDLNFHDLSGVLPESIGNLKHLSFLNLGYCNFFGKIPSSLGNLSYLTHLSLNSNDFTGELPDSIGNLKRLTELQLWGTRLSGNFPPRLLNLSSLTQIDLGYNEFKGMLPSNMSCLSKLESFDIRENSFYGSIPSSLFMIPSLISLVLTRNDFSGPLEIVNISSPSKIETLKLDENSFSGPIPGFISKLVGLRSLDLSFWNTERGIPDFSIFLHLKSLETLVLSYMNTRSMVDLSFFSSLMSLGYLDLSGNNLKINSTLHLPSPIEFLTLSSCNISEFPKFLQNQTRLSHLDLSANQIKGQVPEWLWRLPLLQNIHISQNSLTGFQGPADVIQRCENLFQLDISSNNFEGPFPLLPNSTGVILGSNNQFSGEIPRTICKLVRLLTLDLHNNYFNGSIPQCFSTSLSVLNLRNNSLSGVLPEEIIGVELTSLDVGHNQLSGKLPKSLINCTRLMFLNVEENRFDDTFPFSLGLLPNLLYLVLRSNELYGPIYSYGDSLSFPKLRIFDISENRFTGILPSDYFAGWSAMSIVNFGSLSHFGFIDSVAVTNKGLKMELGGIIFAMYKSIDVSGNKFEGDIPESIGLLKELKVLNMSNNAFTGRILSSIVNLTKLESLDLSRNGLSGEIPPELGKLTFLARMNFSCNKLKGPIPQGTQIQSQNSSSFAENSGLCGAPLHETCGGGGEEEAATKQEEDEEKDQVLSWLAAAIGYVPGVFCGITIGHILISYKHEWFMRIFHSFT